MNYEIVLAGFGGQGILFAGKVLAYAGLVDGKEVSMEASAIVEDGIVYVPCEFFYNVFGWVLYDAGYDMLEKEYTICFDTSDYYYN